jgi:hypothetical protein
MPGPTRRSTSAFVAVLVGVLLYHAQVSAGAALSLLVALALAILAWAGLGTAATAFIPSADAAQPLLALGYFRSYCCRGGRRDQRRVGLAHRPAALPAGPADHRRRHQALDALAAGCRSRAATWLCSPPGAVAALLFSLWLFRWEPSAAR